MSSYAPQQSSVQQGRYIFIRHVSPTVKQTQMSHDNGPLSESAGFIGSITGSTQQGKHGEQIRRTHCAPRLDKRLTVVYNRPRILT